jgi:hypothetical protein
MINLREALARSTHRRRGARRLLLATSGLGCILLLASAVSVPEDMAGTAEAGRLYSALTRMGKLTNRQVRHPAARVARTLPAGAERIDGLRESASTAEAQVSIALGELQQMSALKYDPHYLPALIATGRAFVAITGQDPMTRTAINPEYRGLVRELTDEVAGLQAASRGAGKAVRGAKRLSRELLRAKRRAARLERQLKRQRARAARGGVKAR